MSVRVRFAPSPTGYLHIGGLRTALFCYLFARSQGGTFLLRLEDTDRSRFVADAEEDITTCLEWAGLVIDEGPHLGADYRQSARTALYRQYAKQLLDVGRAYYAFDTPEALREMRGKGRTYDRETRHKMRNAFTLPEHAVQAWIVAGRPHVVRMRIPERNTVRFTDAVKGPVAFPVHGLDDQVIIKSDGQPTYHLANVVDDHLMGITHVIRGEEWLSSTPKHILLYNALGWEPPVMAHLPLILSPHGGKLSKRSAARLGIPVNVRDYRQQGYEPEALVNFLALLGWHPDTAQEVFSREALEQAFTLDRVAPSPARFDLDKLRWFNQQHLRLLGPDEVSRRIRAQVQASFGAVDPAYLLRVLAVVGARMVLRKEIITTYAYFFRDPEEYEPRGVKKRWKADSAGLVRAYADTLEQVEAFDAGVLETALRDLAAARNVGAGRVIHPVRLAASGTTAGPSLFEMLEVLGRECCAQRLRRAAQVLGT